LTFGGLFRPASSNRRKASGRDKLSILSGSFSLLGRNLSVPELEISLPLFALESWIVVLVGLA
jgi:hypothetical protein